MTERRTPPDQAARDRIAVDLTTSLLVEAGAGSGKTTAMVRRMIGLIRTGTATVDQIAAVTFTRKAATELRERFQEELERAAAASSAGDVPTDERQRLDRALEEMAGCFIGTIHAFCGRLLRERPIEAGVPPGFEELTGTEERHLRLESFSRFVERLGTRESRLAARLEELGVRPSQLRTLYQDLSDNPDVRFPAPRVARPDSAAVSEVGERLERLLDDSLLLVPDREPENGWDNLQEKIRRLAYSRSLTGWSTEARILEAISEALRTQNSVTQNRWGADRDAKAGAKALCQRWDDFSVEGGPARRVHEQWLAHRYPHLLRFAGTAARSYAAERRHLGRLSFQDLLLLPARLLRENPEVRRALGARYRYLLVDEFQDTDPIQAEVVFLLASDPSASGGWLGVTPRPGALFVVGDPKQSIYRFRRADIALYGQVKRRFREIGEVLELTANFRSTPPIEAFVNAAFQGPLPPEETEHQAGFAPMTVQRPGDGNGGVFWYRFDADPGKGGFSGPRVSRPDSERLASWIAARIEAGGRRAGDFMILTRTKKELATYARALEARNVPVQASGTGVGVEDELRELLVILRALADPGDAVLTLAALEGLFVGLSHQELYDHTRLGGTFSFLRDDQPEGSAAREPLRMLKEFWLLARSAPADVAIPTIVEKLGVLPYAASGDLGSTRAGALLYALDVIRVAGLEGATSLVEAVEILETGLTVDDEEAEGRLEADAPLFPGDTNAVRLMNLHKAKGLEAKVVVLGCPSSSREYEIERHIRREPDGRAVGFLRVRNATSLSREILACPLGWSNYEQAEIPFRAAEESRLRYVATTRAMDELVIARCAETEAKSFCCPLHAMLDLPSVASELQLSVTNPGPGRELTEDPTAIQHRIEALRRRRESLTWPSYAAASVTTRAKGEASFAGTGSAAGRGVEWGRAAHRALELSIRGVHGEELARACRTILHDEERPIDDQGEPTELPELIELVEALRASPLWLRSREADRVMAEVPFHVHFTAIEARDARIVETAFGDEVLPQAVEGVIDLAFREASGGWVIADYKTDRFASPAARSARIVLYQRQVDLYALCWERLTGEPVDEKVLFFTHDRSEVSWGDGPGDRSGT